MEFRRLLTAVAGSFLALLAACEGQNGIGVQGSNKTLIEKNWLAWSDLELNGGQRTGQQVTLIGLALGASPADRVFGMCRMDGAGLCSDVSAIVSTSTPWTPEFLENLRKSSNCSVLVTATGRFEMMQPESIIKISMAELPRLTVTRCY